MNAEDPSQKALTQLVKEINEKMLNTYYMKIMLPIK